jgi:hypothetical protein
LPSGDQRYPQAIDPDSPDATNPLESIRFAPSRRIRTQSISARGACAPSGKIHQRQEAAALE